MKRLLTIKSVKPSLGLSLKIFKRMRITPVILAGFLFQANAASYSQSARIFIEMDNVTVEEVLNEIEAKAGFYFLYNNKLIDVDRRVSVDVDAENIETVLRQLFKDTDVVYRIADKQIVLSRKDLVQNTAVGGTLQSKVVTGTVVDVNGIPVIGANVMVKGTTTGTITDMDGKFSLEVEENAVLQVSYIGFANQEIKVGSQKDLAITLREDAEALDELVVVGYGTQKKVNLTGSVSSVSSKDLVERPQPNVQNMIQGKVNGLQIVTNSAQPGRDSGSILIRGKGSFGADSAPLILVDGVVGELNVLASEDIESISVFQKKLC